MIYSGMNMDMVRPNRSSVYFLIRGAVIALRKADCAGILVQPKGQEAAPWD